MPNYNITIDSKFNPYSFEDYLKPAMLMQEQHNALSEAYAESLARSANLAEALGSTGDANDAIALQAVNDYENSINNLSADLAQNGLNRANRQGIYNAKSKYGYIDNLKKAMDNRNTFIAKQNELALNDPTRRFSDYASNHGITRFLNPDFTYGSFSEAAIQKQVEDTVKYLAKSTYLRDPNNPEFEHVGGLTYLMKEKTGATDEEINTAMQAIMSGQPLNEKQSKIAQMLYDDAISIANQHLGNWDWDDDLKRKAYEAASRGLYSALGTEDFKPINVSEPRASSSSSKPKDDWLLDPTFIPVLTAHRNKINGFDSLQKEAIENSISYLGGSDEITEMYKRGVGFSPIRNITNTETLRDNITKAIEANERYVKKNKNGDTVGYTKEGEEILKILNDYIKEVNGIQLEGKEGEELEQLRKKEADSLKAYRNGAVGNATTAYMNTFNISTNPPLNDKDKARKETLEKKNEELIKSGKSRYYYKFDNDNDQVVATILNEFKRGNNKLTDDQKKYIETRRQNYIKNHPEVKEIENRRRKTLSLLKETQDFFREGAVTSDLIDLSRGVDNVNTIWRNISTDLRLDQVQDFLGKDKSGHFVNNGKRDKSITDYEQLYDKENGELKKGVHIAFDVDTSGKPGYVLFTDDPNGERAFIEANPKSKSVDYEGMLSYASSMSNQQKINNELNSLRNSDEYIRAIYNIQRKGGKNLTTEEREILNYENQLKEMLELSEQVSRNAGREGFTNFYKQVTLNRKGYVEDPNKQIQVNNYGYNGYEGY